MTESSPLDIIWKYFNYNGFRPGQKEGIEALLNGKDACIVMPTGAGKSLIYQTYSMMQKQGLTLVVSPLISLMKDQVTRLNQSGISAGYLSSGMDDLEQLKLIAAAVNGKVRLLYLSPERALNIQMEKYYAKMKINMIVVDEAHCISRWGHDFRPIYRQLKDLISKITPRPVVSAFTATATEKTKQDIVKNLKLHKPVTIALSFYRPELYFSLSEFMSENDKFIQLIQKIKQMKERDEQSGRMIIYSATRKQAEKVSLFLQNEKIQCLTYHAGISETVRARIQEDFSTGKCRILSATNAFGLGIDIQKIRSVIHMQLPGSVEAYYQEAGRAGRDSLPAECILFFRKADIQIQKFLIRKSANREGDERLLQAMLDYVELKTCRQVFLCNYFGEEKEPCGNCDICQGKSNGISIQNQKIQPTPSYTPSPEEKAMVLDALKQDRWQLGKEKLILIFRGSEAKSIRPKKAKKYFSYGMFSSKKKEEVMAIIEELIREGELTIVGKKYPKVVLKDQLESKRKYTDHKKSTQPEQKKSLLHYLKNYRDSEARRKKVRKYLILKNETLVGIVERLPRNLVELMEVKGMGTINTAKYGEGLLRVIDKYGVNKNGR